MASIEGIDDEQQTGPLDLERDHVDEDSTPTPEQTKRIDLLENRFWRMAQDRQYMNCEWKEIADYVWGNQTVYLDTRVRQHVVLRRREVNPIFVADNRIWVNVQTLIDITMRSSPKLLGVPGGTGMQARKSALLASKLNQHISQISGGADYETALRAYAIQFGVVFEKTVFDPQARAIANVPNFGEVSNAQIGEIRSYIVLPYAMFVPRGARRLRDAIYFTHCMIRSTDHILSRYGFDFAGEDIDLSKIDENVDESAEDEGAYGKREQDIFKIDDKQVLLKEHWERLAEDQYHVTVYAKGRILAEFDSDLLFSECRTFPATGKFWPVSIVKFMIPIQRAINRIHNGILAQLDLSVKNGLLINRFANITPAFPLTELGVVYEYTPTGDGSKPVDKIDTQQISPSVIQELSLLYDAMEKIVGINATTKGEASPGRQTKAEVELLTAADTSRALLITNTIRQFDENRARVRLRLAQRFYTEDRIAYIAGENGEVEAVYFGQADLRSIRDVVLVEPKEFEATLQRALQLKAAGSIPGIEDFEEIAGVSNLTAAGRARKRAVQQAEGENLTFLKGSVPETMNPPEYEDHQTHMPIHNDLLNSEEFRNSPPQLKQIVSFHNMLHARILVQQTQALAPPPSLTEITAASEQQTQPATAAAA